MPTLTTMPTLTNIRNEIICASLDGNIDIVSSLLINNVDDDIIMEAMGTTADELSLIYNEDPKQGAILVKVIFLLKNALNNPLPPAYYKDDSHSLLSTAENAAIRGNLKLLVQLDNAGFPFNTDVFDNAAAYGHLDIVQWLNDNGKKYTSDALICATEAGHIDVVSYLIKTKKYSKYLKNALTVGRTYISLVQDDFPRQARIALIIVMLINALK